jgi:hypothetical protein
MYGVSLRRATLPILIALFAVLPGCGDSTGPQFAPVPETPGEVTLFDFEGSGLTEPSAFDAVDGRAVRTDQTSGWDFLFVVPGSGEAEFRPRNAVLAEDVDAGIQKVDRAFDDIAEAPESGYVTDEPVTVAEGDVLVGRSRQDPSFRITCEHFFKLEVTELDTGAGTVTLRHIINPACGRRNLTAGSPNPAR